MAGQSDACNVGGEEVDAVAVEVAACAVVVLGGARVCVSRQDLSISERDSGVESVGDCGVRSEWGLMCLEIPAAVAIRVTMR
jgi:hypothetical protein